MLSVELPARETPSESLVGNTWALLLPLAWIGNTGPVPHLLALCKNQGDGDRESQGTWAGTQPGSLPKPLSLHQSLLLKHLLFLHALYLHVLSPIFLPNFFNSFFSAEEIGNKRRQSKWGSAMGCEATASYRGGS